MNGSQIHLALTHVPVILSVVSLVILSVAMIRQNDTLIKTAFYFLFFAGITAVPVFFSGEGAEKTVEHLPGVTESVIEKHEELASLSFTVVGIGALVSLAGLVLYKRTSIRKLIRRLVLFFALATTSLMTVTAHLGGQVRHTEIRTGFTQQTSKGTDTGDPNVAGEDKD